VLHKQCRHGEADYHWRAELRFEATFGPAWLGLTQHLLEKGQWAEVEEEVRRWQQAVPRSLDPQVLRARAHLARKEYVEGRRMLEQLIALAPDYAWPRVILNQLLQEQGIRQRAAE
jgi:hypothetical protein